MTGVTVYIEGMRYAASWVQLGNARYGGLWIDTASFESSEGHHSSPKCEIHTCYATSWMRLGEWRTMVVSKRIPLALEAAKDAIVRQVRYRNGWI